MSFCPSTSLLKLYFAILSIPPDPSVSRNAAKVDDALPLTPSKSTCLRHHVPEVKESRGENPNEPFLGSSVNVICGSNLLPLAGIFWYCNFANHLYTPKHM